MHKWGKGCLKVGKVGGKQGHRTEHPPLKFFFDPTTCVMVFIYDCADANGPEMVPKHNLVQKVFLDLFS